MLGRNNKSLSLALIMCHMCLTIYSASVCATDDLYLQGFTEEDFKNAQEVSSGFSHVPSETVISHYLSEESLDFTIKGSNERFGELNPCFGLSIDGGGIRGVMPTLWLQDLKTAYEASEEGIDEPLHKLFDYVGGTSIGGIVSLGVAHGIPLDDILSLFENDRSDIFASETRFLARFKDFFGLLGPRYSADPLETLLKKTFGEDNRLSGLKTNVLVTACTTEGDPWIFKREEANTDKDYRLWEVARSTSAAPTYFEAYQSAYEHSSLPALVDGGIWVNNPALLLTASIVQQFHEGEFSPQNLHILSLGTGDSNNQALPHRSGMVAAGTIIEALMSSHSRGNHMLMSQLLGDQYCRVNAEMTNPIDLADTSQKAYDKMVEYAALDVHQNQIQAFVEQTAGRLRTKLESQDE